VTIAESVAMVRSVIASSRVVEKDQVVAIVAGLLEIGQAMGGPIVALDVSLDGMMLILSATHEDGQKRAYFLSCPLLPSPIPGFSAN
jgi:hypothetical protein